MKPCCIEAKEFERKTLETMTVFQWGSMYNAARKTCDEAQEHLRECAEPRRRRMAARIIAKAESRTGEV